MPRPSTDEDRRSTPGTGVMAPLAGMTGFARRSITIDGDDITWEIKSVNGKGLDVRLRMPPGFDAEEAGVRGRIAAMATRGSIQASLTINRAPAPPRVRVDTALLGALIATLADAVPKGVSIAPATLDGLLSIRGVVDIVEGVDQAAKLPLLATAALSLLDGVLDDLRDARRAEGDALGRLLRDHLDGIALRIEAAERAPGRTAEVIRRRLERMVRDLFDAVPALDPNRLHQEAIVLAMRADIREELDRLRIHVASARSLFDGGGAIGRRVDFLAQELAREANTLCAKSNDAALTAIGLELRNQIEQFREQVQNLE